ncbi:unnamed protein product [Arctogadus glacialis]
MRVSRHHPITERLANECSATAADAPQLVFRPEDSSLHDKPASISVSTVKEAAMSDMKWAPERERKRWTSSLFVLQKERLPCQTVGKKGEEMGQC